MALTFFHTPGTLKRFKSRPWAAQETFKTPMKALSLFVSTLVQRVEPVAGGLITFGEVVSEPRALTPLLGRHGITLPPCANTRYLFDWSISAPGRVDLKEALAAAFADPTDFLFVPDPSKFVVYADHDEYTTLFSMSRGKVGEVSRKLSSVGFDRIRDFQRQF
jgi:hypothetical protein